MPELHDSADKKTRGHSGNGFRAVTFSKDGQRLASGSDDKTVKIWDTATGQEIRTLPGHVLRVWSVAFSPDGTRLASVGGDTIIKLWDAASGQEIRTFQGHTQPVRSVAFSPDGTRLVSASADQIQAGSQLIE